MRADSACLILTLSTYPLMTPRSLNPVSLWCTQKPGPRDLWSCRVSITLKSNQSPGLERGTAPKRRQGDWKPKITVQPAPPVKKKRVSPQPEEPPPSGEERAKTSAQL